MNVHSDAELNTMLDTRGRRERTKGWRRGLALGGMLTLGLVLVLGYLVDTWRCAALEQRLTEALAGSVPSLTSCEDLVRRLTDESHGVLAQLRNDIDQVQEETP